MYGHIVWFILFLFFSFHIMFWRCNHVDISISFLLTFHSTRILYFTDHFTFWGTFWVVTHFCSFKQCSIMYFKALIQMFLCKFLNVKLLYYEIGTFLVELHIAKPSLNEIHHTFPPSTVWRIECLITFPHLCKHFILSDVLNLTIAKGWINMHCYLNLLFSILSVYYFSVSRFLCIFWITIFY